MTMQDLEQCAAQHKRLMTRTDFVGMYRVAHASIMKHVRNGDIEIHLVGTTICIDRDEALKVLNYPPLRHAAPSTSSDLFA